MNKNLRTIVLLLLAFVAIGTSANPVGADAARGMALRFVQSAAAGKMMQSSATMTLAHTEYSSVKAQWADYYVFNASNGSAFVIVSGDDRALPVLAYGDGSLDMADAPCNLRAMLSGYREQMEYLHAHPEAQVELPAPNNDVTIPPLITCDWGQQAPFYNQCPVYMGERSVTGCVATAMAQVIYYWKFPDRLPSLGAYSTRNHHIWVSSLPGKELDWDNMIDNYNATPYNAAQSEAVATLMRYCGQAVRMDYSPTGSGAYVYQQLSAMKAFGYNPNATELGKGTLPYDEWDEILQQELLAGRPILYSANDPMAGGHAFVVDGYFNGKYHVNWGWNGNYNGYFALGAFNVRGYSFLQSQEILHEIYPPTQTSPQTVSEFEVDGICYRYGETDGEAYVTSRDTEYGSYSGVVNVPSQVLHDGRTLTVTAIDDDAFRNSMELTGLTLPESLKRIGARAFLNCVSLNEVVIPEGVTDLGQLSFASCLALQTVTLPTTLRNIAARAFVECGSLMTVHTPSVESWLAIRFADRYANPVHVTHRLHVDGHELTQLVVPEGVEEIGQYAFIECTGLKSVTIPEGVTAIGPWAFKDCTGLSGLELPSVMSSLGNQAFAGCSSLTAIAVPSGISRLNDALFKGCTALAGVMLPNGLKTIGYEAFSSCSRLASVDVPDGVTAIEESAFNSCTGLREIQLPESLTSIGQSAFESCSALSVITIPDNVEVIPQQVFYRCTALREITFGKSVNSIELKSFAECKLLEKVICRGDVPAAIANPDCFVRNIYSTALLLVPAEARPVYKKTGIWPWFKHMVGVNLGYPYGDVNGDGEVNIADVNAVIKGILDGESAVLLDLSGDSEVNIADVNTVIKLILGD
jgi:hypothetical protein